MPLIGAAASGGLAAAPTQQLINGLSLTQGMNPTEQRRTSTGPDRHPDPQSAAPAIGEAILVRVADFRAHAPVSSRDHGRASIFSCPRSDVRHANATREVLTRSWALNASWAAWQPVRGTRELVPVHFSPLGVAVRSDGRVLRPV
ncbi:hypothetical protein GCM10009680_56190 [Streptomyces yatensis]|uniref:Uncharacterized protein n=1 Tax=Streptomyces yatensis TaxID=155177 RepID=A0ABN2IMS9_9ACTN